MNARVKNLLTSRLAWPLIALVALIVANTIKSPNFLGIRIQEGHLFGSLIDILRNGAPIVLVALGMTLVIATRGIDLSVGAVVAISGAFALSIIGDSPNPNDPGVVALGGAWHPLGSVLCSGAWNGFLVSVLGLQPIIATLILMTGGRGIAMLITEGQILTVNSEPYRVIGGGYWFALPASILIAGTMFVIAALLTRKTALGLMIESVGINPVASRLAGVGSRTIVWATYVFSAICAAIAGLMISSNVTAADANSAGLWIEMDAILAVVLGGTSLAGGRYSLTGTLIGAFLIQTLTTTVYSMGIAAEITLVFKALVVITVVLLQSPGGPGDARETPQSQTRRRDRADRRRSVSQTTSPLIGRPRGRRWIPSTRYASIIVTRVAARRDVRRRLAALPRVLLRPGRAQPVRRQRVPHRARGRHDVRDPDRRHRPVGGVGRGAVHDDRRVDAAGGLAARGGDSAWCCSRVRLSGCCRDSSSTTSISNRSSRRSRRCSWPADSAT